MRPVNLTGTTVVFAARPPSLPKQQQNSDSFAAVGRHPSLSPSLLRDSRSEEKRRGEKREAGTHAHEHRCSSLPLYFRCDKQPLLLVRGKLFYNLCTLFCWFLPSSQFRSSFEVQSAPVSCFVLFCSQSLVFRPFFVLLLLLACFLVLFLVVF